MRNPLDQAAVKSEKFVNNILSDCGANYLAEFSHPDAQVYDHPRFASHLIHAELPPLKHKTHLVIGDLKQHLELKGISRLILINDGSDYQILMQTWNKAAKKEPIKKTLHIPFS